VCPSPFLKLVPVPWENGHGSSWTVFYRLYGKRLCLESGGPVRTAYSLPVRPFSQGLFPSAHNNDSGLCSHCFAFNATNTMIATRQTTPKLPIPMEMSRGSDRMAVVGGGTDPLPCTGGGNRLPMAPATH